MQMSHSIIPAGVGRPLERATHLFSRFRAKRLSSSSYPAAAPAQRESFIRQRSNRAAAADLPPHHDFFGLGEGRARTELGHYYATSVSVYSAIKLRADAVSRPTVQIYRTGPGEVRLPLEASHPVRQLLDRVNPWFTRGDLWRATEIYLNLWGSAFWALQRDEAGRREVWPLRPDRVSVIPDRRQYVGGFVYQGRHGPVAYAADEMVWLRYFNPLEEYAGFSPLAPSRLSVDTGSDGMRFNRNFFRNSAQPDFVLLTEENLTDAEVEDFYSRWEARYRGPGNAHRPAIANFIKDIKSLGFSHKDMDFIQGLRWSLEEVSRTYGVPKPLLSDFERATFANVNAAERIFWRNTIVPELKFLAEQLTRLLLPRLGYPDLILEFDLSTIEALQEDENKRVERQAQLLDRGVLTINEVRRERGLPDVPWGDSWPQAPGGSSPAGRSTSLDLLSGLVEPERNSNGAGWRN
jgi:HK97 family phage portal protein